MTADTTVKAIAPYNLFATDRRLGVDSIILVDCVLSIDGLAPVKFCGP